MANFLNILGGGGNAGAGMMRGLQKKQQQQVMDSTNKIDSAFAGFDPQFFAQKEKAYMDYAMPQVQEQATEMQKQGAYKLGGQGLLKSSAALQLGESLSRAKNAATNQVGMEAMNQGNQLQEAVAKKKSDLIGEANTAADPSSSAQSAIGAASQFQSPSLFQPLGELFNGWANMYLQQKNQNAWAPVAQAANSFIPNGSATSQGGYGSSFMQPVTAVNN